HEVPRTASLPASTRYGSVPIAVRYPPAPRANGLSVPPRPRTSSRPAAATRNDPSPRGPARSTTPGRCRNTTQAAGGDGPTRPGLPPQPATVTAATPRARFRNQRTDTKSTPARGAAAVPRAAAPKGSAADYVIWLRRVQDDAFAEQVEAGAAVHLAFDHLDLVDRSLDLAGVPGQGQAVGDGLLVGTDAGREGAQAGLVVGFDGGEPGLQVAAAGAGGHHLGECGDVPGEGVDVRAAGADGVELG